MCILFEYKLNAVRLSKCSNTRIQQSVFWHAFSYAYSYLWNMKLCLGVSYKLR